MSYRHVQPLIREGRRFHHQRPATNEGTWSLRLVGGGFALVSLLVLLIGLTDVHADVGPVSLFGVLALGGLATVIVGGAFATVAIIRRGERSVFVLATLAVWALALFLIVGELAFPH
jgi:hypothetical protein